jgi:enoyl-CoA hydratase
MSTFAHVEQCPLIVIAAVNGLAFGGGCELALACDIVIASDAATFALPEAALGLVPGFGALRSPDVVGRQMTKFLIATGDAINAQRAFEIGIAQLVVAKDELLSQANAIAARIATRSPLALSVAKRMVNRTIDQASQDYSVDEITKLQASEDRAKGVEAFLTRRIPVFGVRQDGEEK